MSEYLSGDILEEGFLRSFAPFRFLQRLFGSCRVDARDLFVTPPTIWQKIYSVILAIVTLSLFFVLVDIYLPQIYVHKKIYNLFVYTAVFDYLVYLSTLLHVRFFFNDKNVKFFITLQEIDRKLNIDGANYLNGFLFKVNIGTLLVSFSFDGILFLFSVVDNYKVTLYSAGELFSQQMCITEWMHYSNKILFFYTRIYYINTIIMNFLNLDHDSYIKTNDFTFFNKETVLKMGTKVNDFRNNNVVECLKELLDAFRTFTILYRFQMFLFCLKFVIHTIVYVQFFIVSAQDNLQMTQERIFLPVKWLSNALVLIFICLRWNKFFGEIEDTKYLCTIVIATHKGPIRKKAARIIKIIEETPPRFTVYDMWNMDTTLLLKMFNIMTTIIITLFQFALL